MSGCQLLQVIFVVLVLMIALPGCCKKPKRSGKNSRHRGKMTPLDKQTQQQLDRLIAYMDQDAHDKADEIELRAQEEAVKEKQRIVKLEQDKQMVHYDKEMARMKLEYKRTKNAARQKSNIDLQVYRHELVQATKADVRAEVIKMLEDPQTYKEFMHGSIREAIYRLLQKQIVVRCRVKDRHILDGLPVEIEGTEVIISRDPLPADCLGGIIGASTDGKLWVDCTVEKRMEHVLHKEEPNTRHNLFEHDKETEPTTAIGNHPYFEELDEFDEQSTIGHTHSARSYIHHPFDVSKSEEPTKK